VQNLREPSEFKGQPKKNCDLQIIGTKLKLYPCVKFFSLADRLVKYFGLLNWKKLSFLKTSDFSPLIMVNSQNDTAGC
jgi:hypothetical protein